jgi:hypothetical protein
MGWSQYMCIMCRLLTPKGSWDAKFQEVGGGQHEDYFEFFLVKIQ